MGAGRFDETVDNYRAINSKTHEADVIAAIATADIVTTAVGPNVLRFVAPVIAAGLQARTVDTKLTVMACENAINATDVLVGEMRQHVGDWDAVAAKAVFANTAVDRIVPGQAADAGLDVTVETYFEWAIETPPFGGSPPVIPDATWVDDLAPYIERKLFTVNTGHASTAYFGFVKGIHKLSDALADDEVRAQVEGVLAETKALLVAKHEFPAEVQQAYLEKILQRFANPFLPDTVDRVGRQPMRKLSRHERLIGPAAELAEIGHHPEFLLGRWPRRCVSTCRRTRRAWSWRTAPHPSADAEATRITGLEPGHPLYDEWWTSSRPGSRVSDRAVPTECRGSRAPPHRAPFGGVQMITA